MKKALFTLMAATMIVAGCTTKAEKQNAVGQGGSAPTTLNTQSTTTNVTDSKSQTSNLNYKNKSMDTFKTKSGKELTFHPIKHASMAITYDGREMQVDPVIKGAQPVTDYTQWPKADFIFITHEHFDHLDKEAVAQLSKASTVIVTNPNSAEILGKGTVMRNGDKLRVADDIMVYAVPAYNTTEGHLQFHPKGRDNGFILEIDGLRIYIAGDTEDIPEMADIKDIDVAFMPCNQPYTMTPAQLRRAADMVRPKVLYPYHFGQTPVDEMVRALDGTGIDVRIRDFQ